MSVNVSYDVASNGDAGRLVQHNMNNTNPNVTLDSKSATWPSTVLYEGGSVTSHFLTDSNNLSFFVKMSVTYYQFLRRGARNTGEPLRLRTPAYYSALSRVPNWIWHRIFDFVVDPTQPRSIYRYTTICFYFYVVLRRCPRLWSNVHFYLDVPLVINHNIQLEPTEKDPFDTEVMLLQHFNQVCRTAPWSLTITVKDPSRFHEDRSRHAWNTELKRIVALCKCLLNSDLSKLTSIRVDLSCLFHLHGIMGRLQLGPLPILNALEIVHDFPQQIGGRDKWKNGATSQLGLKPVPHCGIVAPVLQKLKISLLCISRDPYTGLSSLRFLHITGLRDEVLNRVPASELVHALQNFPKLTILELEGEYDKTVPIKERPMPLNKRIQLPALCHLNITRVHPRYLMKIFCLCDAVNLKWIRLQRFYEQDADDMAHLFSLLNYDRFPSLKRLSLFEVCGEVFQRILPKIPWCQELSLCSTLTDCRHCYTVPAVTEAPTVNLWEPVGDPPKWYCPALKKLMIVGRNPPWFQLGSEETQFLVVKRHKNANEGNVCALEEFHHREYGNELKKATYLDLLPITLAVPKFEIHRRPQVANVSGGSAEVSINPRALHVHS